MEMSAQLVKMKSNGAVEGKSTKNLQLRWEERGIKITSGTDQLYDFLPYDSFSYTLLQGKAMVLRIHRTGRRDLILRFYFSRTLERFCEEYQKRRSNHVSHHMSCVLQKETESCTQTEESSSQAATRRNDQLTILPQEVPNSQPSTLDAPRTEIPPPRADILRSNCNASNVQPASIAGSQNPGTPENRCIPPKPHKRRRNQKNSSASANGNDSGEFGPDGTATAKSNVAVECTERNSGEQLVKVDATTQTDSREIESNQLLEMASGDIQEGIMKVISDPNFREFLVSALISSSGTLHLRVH